MGGCILLPGCWEGCEAVAELLLAAAEPRVGLRLAGGGGAGSVDTDAVGGGGMSPVGAAA